MGRKKKVPFLHNNYAPENMSERFLHWNATSIECYNRKGKCKGCLLNEVLECECVLKKVVLQIYALRGAPPVEKKLPTAEEIWEYIDQGMYLKDIAKLYGMHINTFRRLTQSYGINGRLLFDGDMSKRYKVRKRKSN